MTADRVQILVCVTCRTAGADGPRDADPAGPRPGAALFARLAEAERPPGIDVAAAECLSNCNRGCTVALRGPGRWTYVYGHLDPDVHADTVLDGAAAFRAAPDGLVPWRARSEHFRKNCIARIPPPEHPHG